MKQIRPVPIIVVFLSFFLFFTTPAVSIAKLEMMKDMEMARVTGQGTTNLVIEENTVRLFLDVHTETYGEIDSVKAGYYEKTIGETTRYGWDTNWTGVTLGESYDAPLVMDGLIVRVEFDDIGAQNKRLTGITIGTNNMVGQISGSFNSTTGAINPNVLTPAQTGDPTVMNRNETLTGPLNINGGFFVELNLDSQSPDRGIRTIIGYQESAAVNMTFSGTDWWQE
ncbi:MAG: hypothetical protein JEZ12_26130 [Desulfobacterium sp.]|nr:hypothetical protein [Desulfobacterium sp.]